MFKPGEYPRIKTAVDEMSIWYSRKTLAALFYGLFEAAVITEGEWRAIEVDFVRLTMPREELAVVDGGATSAIVLPSSLQTTFVIFRRRTERIALPDGTFEYVRTVDDIVGLDRWNMRS